MRDPFEQAKEFNSRTVLECYLQMKIKKHLKVPNTNKLVESTLGTRLSRLKNLIVVRCYNVFLAPM